MKIAIFGANGRVGSATVRLAQQMGHTVLPFDTDTPQQNFEESSDVAIDFSLPEATPVVCDYCKKHHCPLVTGVTGRNAHQQQLISDLRQTVAVCEKSNFSTGINMLEQLCKLAASLKWDCEIVETHRKDKKDSPSGTAKQLALTVTQNGQRTVFVHALRCGSNFGRHEVVFATQGESLTLIHQAENVEIFARGAIMAATELVNSQI